MAARHAHERDLLRAAASAADALAEHPDWDKDPLALRDRLDTLIDNELGRAELQKELHRIERTWA